MLPYSTWYSICIPKGSLLIQKVRQSLNLMNLDISKYPYIQYTILCFKVWIFNLRNISKDCCKDKEKTINLSIVDLELQKFRRGNNKEIFLLLTTFLSFSKIGAAFHL